MTNSESNQGIGKLCKVCNNPAGDNVIFGFHKYKDKNGITYNREKYTCKTCEAKAAKQYRSQNPERIAKTKNEYRDSNHGIRWHVQDRISTWRKSSNVPSDLTVDYLVDLYYSQQGLCYYSGAHMIIGWIDGKVQPNTLSLDKIIPEKGYVKGNVVWCTYLVNTMKQNSSEEEFIAMIYKILHKGAPMPNFATKQQLQQIAAHARVGMLASRVVETCLSAAQQGLNSTTIDCHESNTTSHKFSDSVGPHYKKLYAQFTNGQVKFDDVVDPLVEDLILVTGYDIVNDKTPSTIPSLIMFLKIKW